MPGASATAFVTTTARRHEERLSVARDLSWSAVLYFPWRITVTQLSNSTNSDKLEGLYEHSVGPVAKNSDRQKFGRASLFRDPRDNSCNTPRNEEPIGEGNNARHGGGSQAEAVDQDRATRRPACGTSQSHDPARQRCVPRRGTRPRAPRLLVCRMLLTHRVPFRDPIL